MSQCIRRERSYWTTCPCDSCKVERRRARKRFDCGHTYRIPSEQAWAVLGDRIERGWSAAALESACGLGNNYFSKHVAKYRRGEAMRIGPTLAPIIINMGRPKAGWIGAEPSRRRLRALARIGYTLDALSDETGVNMTTLAMCRRQNQRVRAQTANAIEDAYKRLHLIPGPSAEAVLYASRKGWAPPLAWDDIDNLDENPKGLQSGKVTHSGPKRDQLATSKDHRACPRCGVIREVRRASEGICADCKPLMGVAS